MKFAVQAAAFQPVIHVGRVNKSGTAFLDGKEDATDMTLHAVGTYAQKHFGSGMTVDFPDITIEIRVTPKTTDTVTPA